MSQWISEHGIYQAVARALGLENGCDSPDQSSVQHDILSWCQQQALRAESQTGQECSCRSPEYSLWLPWFVAQGLFEYHCHWLPLVGTVNVSQSAACTRKLALVSGRSWLLSLVCPEGNMHVYMAGRQQLTEPGRSRWGLHALALLGLLTLV